MPLHCRSKRMSTQAISDLLGTSAGRCYGRPEPAGPAGDGDDFPSPSLPAVQISPHSNSPPPSPSASFYIFSSWSYTVTLSGSAQAKLALHRQTTGAAGTPGTPFGANTSLLSTDTGHSMARHGHGDAAMHRRDRTCRPPALAA